MQQYQDAQEHQRYIPVDQSRSTSVEVRLSESDVLKLMLEYLQKQGFVRAMRALEEDTGLRSDPEHYAGASTVGALRESVLDGEWDAVLQLISQLIGAGGAAAAGQHAQADPVGLRRTTSFLVST